MGDEEAALVQRWARRQRRIFWWLLPLVVPTTLLVAVLGVLSLDGQILFGIMFLLMALGLPLLVWTSFWRPSKRMAAVSAGHPVRKLRGLFRVRHRGRTSWLEIHEELVAFASPELRSQVKDGESCEAEVVGEGPALVVRVR